MLAPFLIGRNPEQREQIYDDLKRELRAFDHMGHGPLDIALWDLAGKKYNASVAALLGAFRTRLPTYASTYHGQPTGGGWANCNSRPPRPSMHNATRSIKTTPDDSIVAWPRPTSPPDCRFVPSRSTNSSSRTPPGTGG